EKPKTEDEIRADQEKEWRDKLTQAQADVSTWTAEVARLQTILNDNTTPVYGLTANTGRAAVATQLDNAKKQLAAAQQAVGNLQAGGRAPPGGGAPHPLPLRPAASAPAPRPRLSPARRGPAGPVRR